MKISFKTLSFIFFIPLLLLTFPLHSQAEEKVSTQTKDIKILIDDGEVINVSIEDIKERLLKGERVRFVEKQEEDQRTIKSEWIIDALKIGNNVEKIDIKNAIISGDLDFWIEDNLVSLNECNLEPRVIEELKNIGIAKVSLITSRFSINNSKIKGHMKAGSVTSRKVVVFQKDFSLKNSTIAKSVEFYMDNFLSKADFGRTIFKDRVDSHGLKFQDFVSFHSARFEKSASFDNAYYKKSAEFTRSRFQGFSDFSYSLFHDSALFSEVTFEDSVEFISTNFAKEANFYRSTFKNQTYFSKARFLDIVNFSSVKFEEEAIFDEANFYGSVNLRLTKYKELHISWPQLKERIEYISQQDDFRFIQGYSRVMDRSSLQDNPIAWQGAYLRLIKNFENIGDTKSADDAYYHYRCKKYVFCNDWWEKTKWWFGYLFMGLTCGYGVIPWRTIATAGGLIAIFTFCIYFPFSKRDSLELNGEDITKQEWYRRLYNCFYFSVIIFTTVGLGDIKPKGGFKAWAIAEGLLGWLTMALFLVTLANVWLR